MRFLDPHRLTARAIHPFGIPLIILSATFFLSCGANQIPLEIGSITNELPPHAFKILVHFEERLSGRSFYETSWNNTGPFWAGLQNEGIGIEISPGRSFKPEGRPFYHNVDNLPYPTIYDNSGSSIVIPFGRYFVELLETGLSRSFPDFHECFSLNCELAFSAENPLLPILRIKIEDFRVWEHPKGHVNLNIKGRSQFFSRAGIPGRVYRFDRNLSKLPLQSFKMENRLREVNDAMHQLTESVAVDILTYGVD